MKSFQRERKESAFPWLACCLWRHRSSANVEFNLHINLQQKGELESLFQFENALALGICREKKVMNAVRHPHPACKSVQLARCGSSDGVVVAAAGFMGWALFYLPSQAFLSGPVTRHGSIFCSSPVPESALLSPWGVLSHTFMAGLHKLQHDVTLLTSPHEPLCDRCPALDREIFGENCLAPCCSCWICCI